MSGMHLELDVVGERDALKDRLDLMEAGLLASEDAQIEVELGEGLKAHAHR